MRYLSFLKISMLTVLNWKTNLFGFMFNCLLATIIVVIAKFFNVNIFEYFSSDLSSEVTTKIVFFIIALLLFSGVSALMQSIIVDRDSRVFEVISVNMSESYYITGKIVSAIILVFLSFINQLLSLVYVWFINSILFNNFGVFSFGLKISVWNLLSSILIIILSVILSSLLALAISIKVNNINESSGTALIVLLPYIVSLIIIVFLPNNIEELTKVSQLLIYVPLITPIFLLLTVFVNGYSLFQVIGLVYIFLQIFVLYFVVRKVYKIAYYNNKSYRLSELLSLIFVKEKKYARVKKNR